MGFFGAIGGAFKGAGKWLGKEVKQLGDPWVRAAQGDFKGWASAMGHNLKRAAQVGAIVGTGGAAAAPMLAAGAAAGGMVEKGFSGDSGGVSGVLGSGIHGATSTMALGKAGNIGRGIMQGGGAAAGGGGASVASERMASAGAEMTTQVADATTRYGTNFGNVIQSGVDPSAMSIPSASNIGAGVSGGGGYAPSSVVGVPSGAEYTMMGSVPGGGGTLGNIGRGVAGWADNNKEMLIKGAGQWIEGNQRQGVDNRILDIREQQNAYQQSDEYWRRQMLLRGPQSRWS